MFTCFPVERVVDGGEWSQQGYTVISKESKGPLPARQRGEFFPGDRSEAAVVDCTDLSLATAWAYLVMAYSAKPFSRTIGLKLPIHPRKSYCPSSLRPEDFFQVTNRALTISLMRYWATDKDSFAFSNGASPGLSPFRCASRTSKQKKTCSLVQMAWSLIVKLDRDVRSLGEVGGEQWRLITTALVFSLGAAAFCQRC